MRSALLLAAGTLLLASCSDNSTEAPKSEVKGVQTTANDQAQKYIQMNRDVYKGIETGDTTKFAAIADDAVDHGDPKGDIVGGPAIRKYLSEFHRHMEGTRIDILEEAVTGDHLFVRSVMHANVKEDWKEMDLKKGDKFDATSVDLIRFKDNKIVEHWSYMDMREMMKWMTPPADAAATKK